MEQLVISGDVRKNLVTALATAKVILQRAEAKYAAQSKGGLKKAREEVTSFVRRTDPRSSYFYFFAATSMRAISATRPPRDSIGSGSTEPRTFSN